MGVSIGGGITIEPGITISDVGAPLGNYTLFFGTKSPTLGPVGQDPFPANGWTSISAASADDTFATVSLPFTWTYNNTGYTSFYPGSNFYITFGSGSTLFNALSASNPGVNKIFFAGADNSWQRVSRITSGTDYLRLRYEGTNSTSGRVGTPNIVYEITFFNPANTGSVPVFELLVGAQARGTATAGIISGLYGNTALLTGGSLGPFPNRGVAVNQSYVAVGNSTGTSWTIYTGYYLGGTGY